MGRWGYRIFQGDDDMDAISDMSSKYKIDLDHMGDAPPGGGQTAEQRKHDMTTEQVRALINKGLLTRVFADYATTKSMDLYYLFLFCAKAMEVGAHFSEEQLGTLKSRMPVVDEKWILYDEGIEQYEKALAAYPNDGTPFDFESPGLIQTCNERPSAPQGAGGGGFDMINVPPNPPRRKKGSNQPAAAPADPLGAGMMQWFPKMFVD